MAFSSSSSLVITPSFPAVRNVPIRPCAARSVFCKLKQVLHRHMWHSYYETIQNAVAIFTIVFFAMRAIRVHKLCFNPAFSRYSLTFVLRAMSDLHYCPSRRYIYNASKVKNISHGGMEHEVKGDIKGNSRNKNDLCAAPCLLLLDLGKTGLAFVLCYCPSRRI